MKGKKPVSSKKKTWLVRGIAIGLVLVLAGGGAAWYFFGRSSSAQAQSATDALHTTTVRQGDLQISASGSGTLTANQTVDLRFSTNGTVVELNVKNGDTVKKGDVLARLGNDGDLEAGVASAQLALLQAQKTLADLQANSSLALAQAYQNWIKAQSMLTTAQTASERTAYARCSQEVTTRDKAALDQATQKLQEITQKDNGSVAWTNAKGTYDTALANYTYCASYTATEKTSAQAALDIAQVNLQQTETQYNTLKAASGIDPNELALDEAKVKEAQTRLTQAQENLDGATLTAPMDGKVVYMAAGVGSIVDTSTFITLADVSKAIVTVSVDETDLDKLVPGNAATVTFDALPDQTFNGTVTQADAQLTTSGQYRVAKGLITLDANATKTTQKLPLGLNATITVISKQAKNALLVPISALKDLGGQQYAVMVVGNDGQMKLQLVTIGIQDDTTVEITSGLKRGDVVSTGTVQAASNSKSTNNSNNTNNFGGNFGGGAPLRPPSGD